LPQKPWQGDVRRSLVDDQPHGALRRVGAHIYDSAMEARVGHRRHGYKQLAVKVTIGFQKANIQLSSWHCLIVTPLPAFWEV
jgi:hypothetical protein